MHAPSSHNNEFADDKRELLNQFSRVALFLKRGAFPEAGVIDFIDLGEYLAAVRLLFAGVLDHPTILVRDEYHVALDTLQGAEYRRGAFVIGQPGTGKTLFFVYLIVHFLGQKCAVALQFSHSLPSYAFFSDEGVSLQSSGASGPLLNHPSFLPPERMRVIQTTAPKASRWKEWSKQVGARRFVMDVWSKEEVKKLAILLQLNVERMTELAKKWGGVTQYYLTPDDVVEEDYRKLVPVAVRECRMMLEKGVQCDFPDTAPSSFYFVRPRARRNVKPCVVVPTRTLCCFLAEGLQQEDEAIKLPFLKALSQPAETRQAAGYIFESWFHNFFTTEHKEIQCEWIASGAQDGAKQKLPSTATVVSATQTAPSGTPPFYWVPPVRNFPGIDSALILENEIYAIQVTIAKTRRGASPADGLSELRKLLPKNLKDLSWKLVFVGADEDRVESFAKKYTGKIFFPTKNTCVRVGWSVVNPMQEDVIFKRFLGEDDLAQEESMEVEQLE